MVVGKVGWKVGPRVERMAEQLVDLLAEWKAAAMVERRIALMAAMWDWEKAVS